jgi:hypothetical protein
MVTSKAMSIATMLAYSLVYLISCYSGIHYSIETELSKSLVVEHA